MSSIIILNQISTKSNAFILDMLAIFIAITNIYIFISIFIIIALYLSLKKKNALNWYFHFLGENETHLSTLISALALNFFLYNITYLIWFFLENTLILLLNIIISSILGISFYYIAIKYNMKKIINIIINIAKKHLLKILVRSIVIIFFIFIFTYILGSDYKYVSFFIALSAFVLGGIISKFYEKVFEIINNKDKKTSLLFIESQNKNQL